MNNPSEHARTAAGILDRLPPMVSELLTEELQRERLLALATAHALVAIALQLSVDVTMVQQVDG